MKKENLSGLRYGRLTVTTEALPNKYGHTRWTCVCDCGKTVEALASDLKRGGRPSCGCLKSEKISQARRLPPGIAAANNMYAQYRKSAQQRGHAFNLTPNEFAAIIDKNCHYCGIGPSLMSFGANRMAQRSINGNFVYTGVDRKDSSKGYDTHNCVTCCKTCNFAKNNFSYEEFIAYLERVAAFRNSIAKAS